MKSTTPGPKGVRLTREEIAQVKKVAEELGVTDTRSCTMRLAFSFTVGEGLAAKDTKKVVKELEP